MEQDTGSTGLVCRKELPGLQGRASLLQPQHVAGERGYFQPCRTAPSCLTSESGNTTFGERGRCSLISPTDSLLTRSFFPQNLLSCLFFW